MKFDRNVFRAAALVGQFGFTVLAPALLLFWLGLRLDRWLGTKFLVIVLFFVGAIVGMWNVYILAKSFDRKKDEKDK